MAWSDISPAVKLILDSSVHRQVTVQVRGIDYPCWKCDRLNVIPLLIHLKDHDRSDELMHGTSSEAIVAYARDLLSLVDHPVVATIKPRWSRTAQQRYLSMGCLDCDALFGSFPLEEEAINVISADSVPNLKILAELARPALEWLALELA